MTGIVMMTSDVGEYDKRMVLLTRERGKITAFAHGVKRSKSMLSGGCRIFTFGTFELFEGKDAYKVIRIEVNKSFDEISQNMENMCYGSYFLELANYYSVENVESTQMLKLIYASLRALLNEKISNRLVRCIYETKVLEINGEYPEMFRCVMCGEKEAVHFSAKHSGLVCNGCMKRTGDAALLDTSTIYAFQYIIASEIEKLYTFVVNENVLKEMEFVLRRYYLLNVNREFKSLEILRTMVPDN